MRGLVNKRYPTFAPKNRQLLFTMLVVTAVVNSATKGYDTMMMSGLIAIDPFINYFNLNPITTGLLNAAMWIGCIISPLAITPCCDLLGRKLTIFVCAWICLIGIVIQSASQNIAMFIVARIIVGFGCQVTGSAAPLLIAEIVPANFRGSLVGIYFTMFNLGAIIASIVTYGTGMLDSNWSWRLPALLQCIPSIISICLLYFIPESPRWLLGKGNYKYAVEVIQVSHVVSKEDAREKANKIMSGIDIDSPFKGQFRKLFCWKKPMMRRLAIIVSFAFLVEMGGSSVGTYYLTVVLNQTGIHSNQKVLEINMISSCWNFAISVVGTFLFDCIGRKKQAFISLSCMIVCFFVLGAFVAKWGGSTTNRSAQYATLFWMFLFNGFYNFCFTPLNVLYPSEIFPTSVRAAGMAFYQFWNSGFGLIAAFVLPISMTSVGWKFYMINAGYDIIFLPIIYFLWVETKGLTLEQVASLFGDEEPCTLKLKVTDADDTSDSVKTELRSRS